MNIDNFEEVNIQPWLAVDPAGFNELIPKDISDHVWSKMRWIIWNKIDARISGILIDTLQFIVDS